MGQRVIATSRFYHFLDAHQGIAIYFLEGQKIISEMATRNEISAEVLNINRNALLSLLPLNAFLKPNESMGIFIDSEQPYFRFKLEMNETGTFRNMLLHNEGLKLDDRWTGKIRLVKMMPHSKTPYQSVIDMNSITPADILNQILDKSYQSKCHLLLAEQSDQSILIHLLPQKNYDKQGYAPVITLEEVVEKWKDILSEIMQQGMMDEQKIIKVFETHQFSYLSSKKIQFHCPCSKQQMLYNLKKLGNAELDQILKEDGQIEIICDYCNHQYIFTAVDLQRSIVS